MVRVSRYGLGARVRARAALHRRSYVPGLLSIVVPAYMVDEYLGECLLSLRFQTYSNLEIIVVDDGSPDEVARITRSHVRKDPRVRLVSRPNGGLSAARNTGIEAARGEFLTFVDSDDVVDLDAYAGIIGALQSSGSDFAVSNYNRLDRGRQSPATSWVRAAHVKRRLACTLDEFPDIQVNAVAWSKVYRREFWDAAGLSFPEGVLYEDQPVSAAAFAQARTFDVLPEVSVSWRIRHDGTSISQQSGSTRNLQAQMIASHSSLEALEAAGRTAAAEARALQLLTNNMQFFARHVLDGDEEYWALLREAVSDLVRRVPRDVYVSEVHAQHKVLNELVIGDRHADADAFLEAFGQDVRRFRTVRTEQGVRVELPVPGAKVAEDAYLLSSRQLELSARVIRAQWARKGRLVLEGWAFIRNLDLAEHPPALTMALVDDGGRRVELPLTQWADPRVDVGSQHWYADYRPGGFSATLDVDDVPVGGGSYHFEMGVEAGGIRRTGQIREVSRAGALGVLQTDVSRPGRAHTLQTDEEGRLVLLETTSAPYALTHALTGGVVSLTFKAEEAARVFVTPGRDPDDVVASTTPTQGPDGTWHADVDISPIASALRVPAASAPATRRYLVWVESSRGDATQLMATPETPPPPGLEPGTGRLTPLTLARGRGFDLRIYERSRAAVVTSVELLDDEAALTLTTTGIEPGDYQALLHTANHEVAGTMTPQGDDTFEVRFPLVEDRWGRAGLALPQGKYTLTLRSAAGAAVSPVPSAELLDGLPTDRLLPLLRVLVEIFPGDVPRLALHVKAPLAEDERGTRNQRRLREESRVERADLDAVFFRSLYGEVANCNGLGVHEELLRRGTSLSLCWSVRDRAVSLPAHARPLVQGSKEWHEVISRARYHMVNVHQLEWFVKPENQVMIQTMHGYPFKVMGHEWWQKGGFPSGQVRNYDRRAREWDYFVSPATYATPLLEKAFLSPAGSEAKVLEIGYPRNDALLSADAREVRERVRNDLGIGGDQKVAMYAPTFRDYLSADDNEAQLVDFFDVGTASRLLGDDYVFLIRGHAFNARAQGRLRRNRTVIDVTDHPDINELILASDVAILDYSSLRFDYAVTGKPMIFLVPDLKRYNKARGGVIAFEPTAPGPHVTNTRQVVQQLRDLDGLLAGNARKLERFRKDYVDLEDGHAAARLVDAVFVPRGDAPPSSGHSVER